jgi:hypothetical protein
MENAIGWDALFFNGSVVDLDVGVWTARTSIKERDLAIENTKEVQKVLALGAYRLAPKEAFQSVVEIGNAAKRAVEYHSLTFPFVRGARYVPEKNMDKLLAILKGYQDTFTAAADLFAEKIGETRDDMAPAILKALQDATKDPTTVDRAFNRIMAEYPTREEVRRKFRLVWTVYAIRGTSSAAAGEIARAETDTVKGIVRGMVEQLRGEFTDKTAAIMAVLTRGGKVRQDTIESARETIKRIDDMNIFNDVELSRQVKTLAGIIDRAEQYSGRLVNGGILGELATMATTLEASAATAVQDAENALVQMGRRRLDLGPAPAEAPAGGVN